MRQARNRSALSSVIYVGIAATGALAASAAVAKSGMVDLTTYLRAGPGQQYAVLDEIEPRRQVEVQSCDNGWCRVIIDKAAGFIEAARLSGPDIHTVPPGIPPSADCFTALLNGAPRSGDDQRICRK